MNPEDPRLISDDEVRTLLTANGHADVRDIELVEASMWPDGMTGYWKVTTPEKVFWVVLAKKAGGLPETPTGDPATWRGPERGG